MKRSIIYAPFFFALACTQIVVDPEALGGDGDTDTVDSNSGGTESETQSGGAKGPTGSGGKASSSSGGRTGSGGDDDEDGSGGRLVAAGGSTDGDGGNTGGDGASGGVSSSGGRSGSGGSSSGGTSASGGADTGPCEAVVCGEAAEVTGDVCFEFTTSAYGGWQASNTVGCSISFDDTPTALNQGSAAAGSHTLAFSGCTSPDISWSCWK